ncbi:HAD-IIIA family hydrolase [uncultured Abyssibacter sp.]|uniref:D-glycero-alpha-D-manno-heptose-1,7-bisphosphate 7-phosphatase n=1 Tax=uncultured Abyssibacter sp. TaxID=2320202 RepID=UPI0032B30CA4|tara:strand:- start:155 stop:685 length:531 start_codon:yes stop_codon:yes gene_type:complete
MKLVILGRDGVINEPVDGGVRRPADWRPIPGSLEAVAQLNQSGVRVCVVTHQPLLGSGELTHDDLFAIHQRMQDAVSQFGGRFDAIAFNPHSDAEDRQAGKAALIQDIARRMQIDAETIAVLGDEWNDVQAARSAGTRPVLVRTGHGAATEAEHGDALSGVRCVESLHAFAQRMAG